MGRGKFSAGKKNWKLIKQIATPFLQPKKDSVDFLCLLMEWEPYMPWINRSLIEKIKKVRDDMYVSEWNRPNLEEGLHDPAKTGHPERTQDSHSR
jgi:hypothetical protein